ncbi:YbaN family protein [Dongia rigui]|uniref:YbaN family protein n=1 Tax=Dongia rigui TaxID=940149 RepID=A0ABU5DUL1_9PROT|nr:YbaN family protein [Dongia rigui]MDY0870898.1 YbaN family protein [Dongia rigui]
MTRAIWAALGLLSTGAGIAGIVLPLLPTTPFILLAAFCFARSSPRLEAWILTHRTFGPMIENWRRHGSVDRRAKRMALVLMGIAFLFSLALALPLWLLATQGAVLIAVAAFLLTRPDGPPPAP